MPTSRLPAAFGSVVGQSSGHLRRPPPTTRRALEGESTEDDWRDFRARLVQRERTGTMAAEAAGDGPRSSSGWAYQTDLLEQGSLILSVAGDYWSLRRQYFSKVVMLVISHTPQFSAAVVLNRPTNLTTKDVGISLDDWGLDPIRSQISRLWGRQEDADEWPVWFGGDCEGLELAEGMAPKHFCLHTLPSLAAQSRQIINGVFLIDFKQAVSSVREGLASKEDFMVFVGYTGWGPGQLEDELARGGAWILGAADQGLLLGEPGGKSSALFSRMRAVCSARTEDIGSDSEASAHAGVMDGSSATGVGDGIHHWNELFKALRPAEFASLDRGEEGHNDRMIRRWVNLYLNPKPGEASTDAIPPFQSLKAGSILRGSATHWVLGRPDASWPSRERVDPWQVPGQYMHKAVLFLLEDWAAGGPASLVLVNGPAIGSLPDGRAVRFGGIERCSSDHIVQIEGAGAIAGKIILPPGLLDKLLHIRAVTVAEDASVRSMFSEPALASGLAWETAGGTINSLADAATASQGDHQLRKWYREMLGISASTGRA